MVLLWYARRKKPRIFHTPQEAWEALLDESRDGFRSTGLPSAVQVWSVEVTLEAFAAGDGFFPQGFWDGVKSSWSKGDPGPMLALLRGMILYAVYKPRWEKMKSLVASEIYRRGKEAFLAPARVTDDEGESWAIAVFYGRYPIFTFKKEAARELEEKLRALDLRRMDTFSRTPFSGYVRWLPKDVPLEEESLEEHDPYRWVPISTPSDFLPWRD